MLTHDNDIDVSFILAIVIAEVNLVFAAVSTNR